MKKAQNNKRITFTFPTPHPTRLGSLRAFFDLQWFHEPLRVQEKGVGSGSSSVLPPRPPGRLAGRGGGGVVHVRVLGGRRRLAGRLVQGPLEQRLLGVRLLEALRAAALDDGLDREEQHEEAHDDARGAGHDAGRLEGRARAQQRSQGSECRPEESQGQAAAHDAEHGAPRGGQAPPVLQVPLQGAPLHLVLERVRLLVAPHRLLLQVQLPLPGDHPRQHVAL